MERNDFPLNGPRAYLDKQSAVANIPLILRDMGMPDISLRSMAREHVDSLICSLAEDNKSCVLIGRKVIYALGPEKFEQPGIAAQEPNFYAGCLTPSLDQSYCDLVWKKFNEMALTEPEFITLIDIQGKKAYQIPTGFSSDDLAAAAISGKEAAEIDSVKTINDLAELQANAQLRLKRRAIRWAIAGLLFGGAVGGAVGYELAQPDGTPSSNIALPDGGIPFDGN